MRSSAWTFLLLLLPIYSSVAILSNSLMFLTCLLCLITFSSWPMPFCSSLYSGLAVLYRKERGIGLPSSIFDSDRLRVLLLDSDTTELNCLLSTRSNSCGFERLCEGDPLWLLLVVFIGGALGFISFFSYLHFLTRVWCFFYSYIYIVETIIL